MKSAAMVRLTGVGAGTGEIGIRLMSLYMEIAGGDFQKCCGTQMPVL